MSVRERELRIISSEPILARILEHRRPILISKEGYDWIVGWIRDVGIILRSREMIARSIAMAIQHIGVTFMVELLTNLMGKERPIIRLARLGFLRERK